MKASLIDRILRFAQRRSKNKLNEYRDRKQGTYLTILPQGELARRIRPLRVSLLEPHLGLLGNLAELYIAHRFDLLGSGWVRVIHGMSCRGLEGHRFPAGQPVKADASGAWMIGRINQKNLAEAQRIWRLVDGQYVPIDWHLDFKSGYRWPEDTWYVNVRFGHKAGVDIKVPWELARMQHLPQLALAHTAAPMGGQAPAFPQRYSREFRNQVLDFIANNPPRFGVNWRSAMEVAIRVTNWLVAYDLFRAHGVEFDTEFEAELKRSVYQHGSHIVNNLEWYPELRGNHYLADIAGLLFVSAYLPRTTETDAWLAFAVQELVAEVDYQFHSEGTNFEASTCYHCLSSEIVTYATALVLGLPADRRAALGEYDHRPHRSISRLKPAPMPLYPLGDSREQSPFPAWYLERLRRMAEFTVRVAKGSGEIPQIGDDDSGRFLKLIPTYRCMSVRAAKQCFLNLGGYSEFPEDVDYWYEETLDHRKWIGAIDGLFGRLELQSFAGGDTVEAEIIRSYSGGKLLPSPATSQGSPNSGTELASYPDFGVFIYRRSGFYLAVRCGGNGQNGNGGHCHNDKLSFELSIGGTDFIVDGGSYLYTSDPEIRNAFRSTWAHNTVVVEGKEQNIWRAGFKGLFSLSNDADEKVIHADTNGFEGTHRGFGARHYRAFSLTDEALEIKDELNVFDDTSFLVFNLHPMVELVKVEKRENAVTRAVICRDRKEVALEMVGVDNVVLGEGLYSPGYGQRMRNTRLVCRRCRPTTVSRFSFVASGERGKQ